jgi:hypothetical protein
MLGSHCRRIPDGETGERGYWIRWQQRNFDACKDLALENVEMNVPGFEDSVVRPYYRIRQDVDPENIDLGDLGYAEEAARSFEIFSDLVAAGEIASDVRFQVSLPTPMALLCGFVVPDDRLRLEPAVTAAIAKDVAKLQGLLPPHRLAVQWDVCYELLGADGGPPVPYDDPLEGAVSRVASLCGLVGDAAECGLHLCYGDPGHQHIVEPGSLEMSVKFANAICSASQRSVDFVHMPVPRNRSDDAYFSPLAHLELPDTTELILGLVHRTDGVAGSRNRMSMADRYADGYSIATECGFGRRDPGTIHELLKIHRELC